MPQRKELEGILRKIQAKFSRFYSKVLTEKNLTIPQFSLLILGVDEGALPMSEIAERMYIASPSVTNLVDRLEKQNMVKRTPHPDDRRSYLIEVLPEGRKVVDEIRKLTVGKMAVKLESFSERDIEVIQQFYQVINC